MAGGRHTLAELLHLGLLQDAAEFRLADQKGLQQGLVGELEVGEHAQFLDRTRGEVLRLVDDEQAALALGDLVDEEGLQRHQQLGLGRILDAHTEGRADHAQRVFGIELGRHDIADDDIAAVQAVQQPTQQRGLAGTDLAGDDDETVIAQHAIVKVGLGPAVLLATEVEVGIRAELEGLAAQPVKGFIHVTAALAPSTADDAPCRVSVGAATTMISCQNCWVRLA